MIKMYIGLHVK